MRFIPSTMSRYLLLFICLLGMVAVIEALAKSVAGWGNLGFAVTLWACFGAAYGWLLIEPDVRAILVKRRGGDPTDYLRVQAISVALAADCDMPLPRLYIYESGKFDVMVSGIGRSVTILVSEKAVQLDDAQLRAVLAHEFGHIRLGHAVTRLALYGSLLSLAIIGPSTAAVAIPANFFVLWTMRRMEFAADGEAARLVGAPSMCRVLAHVAKDLGDVAPWQTVFSTHPPFKERISRLQEDAFDV